MKMELNEAIERLNKAGLIVEDIYDNEEELAAIDDEMQKGADAFKRAASTTNQKWRTKHMNDADKHQTNVFKLQRQYRERHPSLQDKIDLAQEFNRPKKDYWADDEPEEATDGNQWEAMSNKEKIAALKKLIDDGYKFQDSNPLNPDSSDIFADFYDIPELADIWQKATSELEDIYLEDENNYSADWDDWLISYGDDIVKDILDGKSASQIVKEYKSCLD